MTLQFGTPGCFSQLPVERKTMSEPAPKMSRRTHEQEDIQQRLAAGPGRVDAIHEPVANALHIAGVERPQGIVKRQQARVARRYRAGLDE